MLDRVGVSVVERTRRLVVKYCKYSVNEYKKVMNDIKKRVRKYSI